jgi:hypothetical protein
VSTTTSELLHCTECEERFPFPSELLLYQSPDDASAPAYRKGNWVPLLTNRVWCSSCDGPRYTERVPSLAEFHKAAAVRRLPNTGLPMNVEDDLLQIGDDEFSFLFTHLATRRGTDRCLTCGSTSVLPLRTAIDRVLNFRHTLCDGALYLKRAFCPGYGERTIRWFAVSGDFLVVQQDRF